MTTLLHEENRDIVTTLPQSLSLIKNDKTTYDLYNQMEIYD